MRLLAALPLIVIFQVTASGGCAPAPEAESGETADASYDLNSLHAKAVAAFDEHDATEDGWLSGTELKACACAAYDADGDGEVTDEEYLRGYFDERGAPVSGAYADEKPSNRAEANNGRSDGHEAEQSVRDTRATASSPPHGLYAVYQWNGAANAYQYRLALAEGGRYRVNDGPWGTYEYDPAAGKLLFSGGRLDGFHGLYYTEGRNADGPTIALSYDGPVADLEGAALGKYQYARFRPDGLQ